MVAPPRFSLRCTTVPGNGPTGDALADGPHDPLFYECFPPLKRT